MENALFYTFSTISQTLAGAISLLAGFVLFQLQTHNAELNRIGEQLAHWIERVRIDSPTQATSEIYAPNLCIQGKYTELLVLAGQIEVTTLYHQASAVQGVLAQRLKEKSALIRRFIYSLLLTIGLVVCSVILLMVTPELAKKEYVQHLLAGIAFWFLACIGSYGFILWKAVR